MEQRAMFSFSCLIFSVISRENNIITSRKNQDQPDFTDTPIIVSDLSLEMRIQFLHIFINNSQ